MSTCVISIQGSCHAVDHSPHAYPELSVPVFDRGFLYGDSLYEVLRTYDQKPFGMAEHMSRIQSSARLAKMNFGPEIWSRLERDTRNALKCYFEHHPSKPSEAYCRMIITRGAGKIGFSLKCIETEPMIVILVLPLEDFGGFDFEKGMELVTASRLRNPSKALDPAMKSGNYLNSLLAYLEATEAGAQDAILCDSSGFVTEGTTFNVFYARGGVLATPPLDVGILEGITRKHLLRLACENGIEAREVRFTVDRLKDADEIFIASSLKEAFPVTRLDHQKVGNGKPGPITRKLRDLFHRYAVETSARENP